MEKSACIRLTQHQLDLIRDGIFPATLNIDNWDIEDFNELKALIDSGQYRIVDEN